MRRSWHKRACSAIGRKFIDEIRYSHDRLRLRHFERRRLDPWTVGVRLMATKKEKACPAATGQAEKESAEVTTANELYHEETGDSKHQLEKDKEMTRLILENNKLKKNQVVHCIGCRDLKLGNVFCYCKRLGVVNPWEDYCSKRTPGGKMLPRPKGV